MNLCACGHDFTDHYQTDVEYLCILCSWCDGYTKAAANDSAAAPVPAGGTPEGLAREKVEMTDSEVKPSSPTTEAPETEDALYELIRVSKNAGMNAASDLGYFPPMEQADEAEIKAAAETLLAAARDEGRREAVREIHGLAAEHRFCQPAKYEGCYSHWPTPHCRADGMAWPCDVDRIRGVAGLEGEGRSPIGSNASESPRTEWRDPEGPPEPPKIVGDASEPPPTRFAALMETDDLARDRFGDASESPPTEPLEAAAHILAHYDISDADWERVREAVNG